MKRFKKDLEITHKHKLSVWSFWKILGVLGTSEVEILKTPSYWLSKTISGGCCQIGWNSMWIIRPTSWETWGAPCSWNPIINFTCSNNNFHGALAGILSSTKCSRLSLNIRIINRSFANTEIFRTHLYTLILYLMVDSPDNCTFNKPCQVRMSGQIDSVLKYDREGQVLFDSAPFQLQN